MPVLAAIETGPRNEDVIATADEIATGLGTDVVVVHVLDASADRSRDATRARIEEVIERAVDDPESVTIRLVEESGGTTDLPSGRVADAILRVADDVDPDYIVVGTHKQTPVGKAMLGSVAQGVLLDAEQPVVTVRQAK